MKRRQNISQDGYIVLITVLLLGAIATLLAGYLLLVGQNASLTSRSLSAGVANQAAAEACAQLGLAAIAASPDAPSPLTNSQTIDAASGQSCSYAITGSSPTYTIDATGTVEQASRRYVHRLELITSQVSPNIELSTWRDVQ